MKRRVTPQIRELFFPEAREHLTSIRQELERHRRAPDAAATEEIHRRLHSLKGSASMIGFDVIFELAGAAELRLESLLNPASALDQNTVDFIEQTTQQLDAAIDTVERQVPNLAAQMDDELAATVTAESRGYLEQITSWLRILETQPQDEEAWSEILRPLHTLKGTAGMVGLTEVNQLAHRMEDLLTAAAAAGRQLDKSSLKLLFRTSDLLVDLVEGDGVQADVAARVVEAQRAFSEHLDSTPTAATTKAGATEDDESPSLAVQGSANNAAESAAPSTGAPARQADAFLRIRADRLDGVLHRVGDVTLQRNAFDQQVSRLAELRNELQLNLRRMARIGRLIEGELETQGLSLSVPAATPSDGAAAEFDSLEMDRYTTLNRLARQLEEATSDSTALGSSFESVLRQVEGFQGRLGTLTRDIQERLAQLRTVPFSSLSGRLHRTVRVTAEKRGKTASLKIINEGIELDKNVIEEIAEPLLHLLRNAVDHGIESAQRRRDVGKPESGSIEIEVSQEGTEGVLRIRDDGAGLNLESIRTRAVNRGLVTAEDAASLSSHDLHQFLFHQGFSTASQLSDISGRGVGLAAALASIERLRGLIEVESVENEGSTFTIRLPASQSILRVLLVSSGDEPLALPLASVEQVESIEMSDLIAGPQGSVLDFGGSLIPVLELETSLGFPPRTQHLDARTPAVVLRVGSQHLALLAERILGVQETVVRPMAELFPQRLYGLSGAALTGDGRVALVLNPIDLLRKVPELPQRRAVRQDQPLEVLIVDDSLSVRQILSRLMEHQGWRPIVAYDGEDALEKLQAAPRVPDVALVDIEMPRMDGFELTRTLHSSPIYSQMPVLILTTRSGQKHRQKAFQLGASEYLIKPYDETTLLDTIRRSIANKEAQP